MLCGKLVILGYRETQREKKMREKKRVCARERRALLHLICVIDYWSAHGVFYPAGFALVSLSGTG